MPHGFTLTFRKAAMLNSIKPDFLRKQILGEYRWNHEGSCSCEEIGQKFLPDTVQRASAFGKRDHLL
jgi:hypothetical protein